MSADVSEVVVTIIGRLGNSMEVKIKDITDPALKAEVTQMLTANRAFFKGKLVKRLK